MSWNNQGGGPWRSPGRGPWGQGPFGPPPTGDLEEIIRRVQEALAKLTPGGSGGGGGKGFGGRGALFLALAALLLWFAWGTFYTVQPNEVGINLVFGRYTGKTAAGPQHQLALADRLGDQGSGLGSADHRGRLSQPRRAARTSPKRARC